MSNRLTLICGLVLNVLLTALHSASGADAPDTLRLTLPREFYAVVGQDMSVYFDNVVLTQTPEEYQFKVQCPLGHSEQRRWTVQPRNEDVGVHDFELTVSHPDSVDQARAKCRLQIVPADAGRDDNVTLLIVGDSLTHATLYPNELARLLSLPGNPAWKMLGTHRPTSAAAGVQHEGYGGWTWQRFVSHYEPNPDGTYRKRSSPFVFLSAAGKPELNVGRYFSEAGARPDVTFFLLGINDCFGADPEDPAAIDARIDSMFEQADALLKAFREACPETDLALCVTTPPNARESGFEANYKGRYHRWGWKRIQHRLVERQLAHFDEQNQLETKSRQGRLFLVPTELNLDPIDGYPENNGVHPNATGYQQIGGSLYAWLKWRLATQN